MVQTRGQQVGDHSAPQKGGSTPSKQTECGFAAGDVASPIFTAAAGDIPKLAGQENIITKDLRRSGHNRGLLQLALGTQESVRGCQAPVFSGQGILTTDQNVDKQIHCDSKNTANIVSKKQQAPPGQQGMGSRSTCVDTGSRAALIQNDEYDGLTPYQGAPTDEDIYYDSRPPAFPVGLMPRTS